MRRPRPSRGRRGGEGMGKYLAVLKIDDEELKSIFEDLKDAEEKIWSCYGRLKELGVIEVCKKETASGN